MQSAERSSHSIVSAPMAPCARGDTIRAAPPSMPARLLHPRAHLGQLFQPRVDLRAGHGDILEVTVVEPVQRDTRGVALAAGDHGGEEAGDEAAAARQEEGGSPSPGPGGGSRNGRQ